MLALLLGRLRWAPDAVWRASLREIALALGGPGTRPMRASDLQALVDRFPDGPNPVLPTKPQSGRL